MAEQEHGEDGLRLWLRVKPGASRDRVGGRYGEDEPAVLIVAVQARAVEGAANRAVVDLVARAFGLRAREVVLVSGDRSRTKVVALSGDRAALTKQWESLLAAP
jgi:uncharacterized protein